MQDDKLEKLLQMIHIDTDEYKNAYLNKIVVSKKSNIIKIYLTLENMIKLNSYIELK